MYGALDISASALTAQRTNLNVIAGNIANMGTTRGVDGMPYQRRIAVFAQGNPSRGADAAGVHIRTIEWDTSPFRKVFDPSHPDAVKSGEDAGYVLMPNVEQSTEMVNAMMAARAYEANVTVMEITKSMAAASLRLLA
jgi:flagellar basal-body rod protein FlgC